MKHHHKSHHIFIFLGALLVIFLVFFGLRYFQSEYDFENILTNNQQSYEEGDNSISPFLPHPDNLTEQRKFDWVRFGSGHLSFLYPDEYALRIINGSHVKVIPPLPIDDASNNCDMYTDEQERSSCMNPDMSPHITIVTKVSPDGSEEPRGNSQDIQIGDMIWKKTSYQDEFGGSVWYTRNIDTGVIEVSYRYVDTPGGMSFDTVRAQRGNQYQLDVEGQNKLTLAIMKSIEVK